MQTIYLDISNKGVVPTIYAKQGDVGRKFEVVLTDSGLPYIPAGGSVFSVWYSGTGGEGNYTDIGDKSAFSVSGNKVTVEIIAQMLLNDGDGIMSLVINSADGSQIASWNINYLVESVPGVNSEEAKSYYTAFSKAIEDLPYPDTSLSVAGKAADSAAAGQKIMALGIESTDYLGCFYRIVGGNIEWINPPMQLGVEYRTTERWQGKAVYTKLVSIGNLPDNATAVVEGVVDGGITSLVGLTYSIYSSAAYTFSTNSQSVTIDVGSDGTYGWVNVTTTKNMADYGGYVCIKYTKD